jgi:hypothetical protein
MKKKAKRYQEGGVLRDRFGNPVRSGSGEAVRTRYPERSYDEQSTASMTESSDYSGRRMKSPERSTSDMDSDSSYMPSGRMPNIGYGNDEETSERKITDYIRTSPKEDSVTETVKEEVKPKPKPKPKPKKKLSGMFGDIDSDALNRRRLEGLKKEDSPYGKSERLKALAGTFSADRAFKSTAASTPYGRSKMGMKSGGKVSSASSRADGIAQRGKTKGRIC